MNDDKKEKFIEFLMTYGFAIVIIILAVTGLYFLGVFDKENFMPNDCKIRCEGRQLQYIQTIEDSNTTRGVDICQCKNRQDGSIIEIRS